MSPGKINARRSVNLQTVSGSTGVFTTPVGVQHKFSTGEKVIIIADDGDLPENILEHRVYFITEEIQVSNLN